MQGCTSCACCVSGRSRGSYRVTPSADARPGAARSRPFGGVRSTRGHARVLARRSGAGARTAARSGGDPLPGTDRRRSRPMPALQIAPGDRAEVQRRRHGLAGLVRRPVSAEPRRRGATTPGFPPASSTRFPSSTRTTERPLTTIGHSGRDGLRRRGRSTGAPSTSMPRRSRARTPADHGGSASVVETTVPAPVCVPRVAGASILGDGGRAHRLRPRRRRSDRPRAPADD